jgi:hypothetical protein
VTVPAIGAETCNSVFIASRITSAIPASTDWPTSTSIFQTLRWIQARQLELSTNGVLDAIQVGGVF